MLHSSPTLTIAREFYPLKINHLASLLWKLETDCAILITIQVAPT